MADQHLKFHIGSEFSGEGFKQAQAAVSSINSKVNHAYGAFNKVAGAMGGMDSSAAKAAASVTGLMNAFLSGGAVGAAITLTISAVTAAFSYFKTKAEDAKKSMEDFRAASVSLASSVNNDIFNRAISDAEKLSKNFETITKHANAMTAAITSLSREQAKGGALDLQAEQIVTVMNEITSEGANLKAAEYEMRRALENAAQVRAQGERDVAAAHQKIVDTENKIVNLGEQRAAILSSVAHLENNIAVMRQRLAGAEEEEKKKYLQNQKDWESKLNELKKRTESIDNEILNEKNIIKVLTLDEQTAIQKSANANKQAENAILQLEAAAEQRARQEREAFEKKRKELQAQETLTALNKEAQAAQEVLNEAKKHTAEAEKEYAASLKKYQENYAKNKINEEIFLGKRNDQGMSKIVDVSAETLRDIVKFESQQRADKGAFRSVRDRDNFERERIRELKTEVNKDLFQTRKEAQRYEQLKNKSDKSLSVQDREFKKKYEDMMIDEAMRLADQAAKKRELERAREAQDQAQREAAAAQQEAAEYAKKIHQQLKNLGLK